MKILLLFDREPVIDLIRLRDGGNIIYTSWDGMMLIMGMFGEYTAATREGGRDNFD